MEEILSPLILIDMILKYPINPSTTEPQAIFLLLENDNLSIIN